MNILQIEETLLDCLVNSRREYAQMGKKELKETIHGLARMVEAEAEALEAIGINHHVAVSEAIQTIIKHQA